MVNISDRGNNIKVKTWEYWGKKKEKREVYKESPSFCWSQALGILWSRACSSWQHRKTLIPGFQQFLMLQHSELEWCPPEFLSFWNFTQKMFDMCWNWTGSTPPAHPWHWWGKMYLQNFSVWKHLEKSPTNFWGWWSILGGLYTHLFSLHLIKTNPAFSIPRKSCYLEL